MHIDCDCSPCRTRLANSGAGGRCKAEFHLRISVVLFHNIMHHISYRWYYSRSISRSESLTVPTVSTGRAETELTVGGQQHHGANRHADGVRGCNGHVVPCSMARALQHPLPKVLREEQWIINRIQIGIWYHENPDYTPSGQTCPSLTASTPRPNGDCPCQRCYRCHSRSRQRQRHI